MLGHTKNTSAHTESTPHTYTAWDIIVKSDLANVIILAIVFIYLGNKFLPKIIDQRKNQISKELEEAKQTRIKAQEELKEIEQRSKEASIEIERIKEDAKETAGTIKKQIEEETEKELEQLKLKIKREITSNYEDAIQSIKRASADTAIKLAEEALTKVSKNQEVQKKLISDFITELDKPSKN